VVGGGGVWLLMADTGTHMGSLTSTSTPQTNSNTSASSTITTLPTDTSGTVVVEDQAAGKVVIVKSVTVPPPGVWVAVRDVTNGKIGNVLGARHARGPVSNL